MKEISDIFPTAASLIEDLHLSACYSGNEQDLAAWRGVFPNISTIWAYSGSAPGSYSGATRHLSIWNKATKGNKIALERNIAANTRKGKLDEIKKYEQTANTHSSSTVRKVKDLLIHGLKNLERDYIPENWI